MYSLYSVTGVLEGGGARSPFRHENTFRNEATLQGYQIFVFFFFFFLNAVFYWFFFKANIFLFIMKYHNVAIWSRGMSNIISCRKIVFSQCKKRKTYHTPCMLFNIVCLLRKQNAIATFLTSNRSITSGLYRTYPHSTCSMW